MDIMKKFKEIIKDGSSAAYGAKGPHQIAGDRKSRYQKCSGAVINALGNIAAFIQVSFWIYKVSLRLKPFDKIFFVLSIFDKLEDEGDTSWNS